jgi:rsbT antagonist protein RsbS
VHVPILKQRDYLIATIQSALTDADLLQLRDDLADRVGQFRSQGVIIDVTVLDVIDSFATRTLRGIAHMLKLRGAETVIAGIQPEIAFAMVQLGLTLVGVGTVLDLEEGLAYLDQKTKRATGGRRQVFRADPAQNSRDTRPARRDPPK